jgi:hypothetical protein
MRFARLHTALVQASQEIRDSYALANSETRQRL